MKLILSSCDFRNEKSQKVIMDNLYLVDIIILEECSLIWRTNEDKDMLILVDASYDNNQNLYTHITISIHTLLPE